MVYTFICLEKEEEEGDRHNDLEGLSTVQASDFARSNPIRKSLLKSTISNSSTVLFLQRAFIKNRPEN